MKPKTYAARPISGALQIVDALTGAPWMSVSTGSRGLASYNVNGSTLTITYQTGVTEIWDLDKRYKLR